jgi:predicted GNAT family N-acyltransferase
MTTMRNTSLVNLHIRAMSASDSNAVSRLILTLFDEFIAPGYSKKARKTFRWQTRRQTRCQELMAGEMRLVAVTDSELVGVIGVRDVSHVHWLWVRKDWHRRGVASILMANVIAEIRRKKPDAASITLNSSPYAMPVYLRLGFRIVGEEFDEKGLICTPMALDLGQKQDLLDLADSDFIERNGFRTCSG